MIVGFGCAANIALAQTPEAPATPTTPATDTPAAEPPATDAPATDAPATDAPATDAAAATTATEPPIVDPPTTPETTPEPTAGETPQNAATYGYGLGPDDPTPPKAEEKPKAPQFQIGDGWKLKMSGQFRPRVWTSTHKVRDLLTDDFSWLINQRARLGASLAEEDGMEFFFQIQDVRIWGEEENTLNTFSAAGLDAHQAYGYFPITDEFSLKLGRQEIVLDNSRLVGNVGWTQRARSFDAGRAIYKVDQVEVQALYAKVRETTIYPDGHVPVDRNGDVDFAGAQASLNFAKKKGGDGSRIAALYLANIKHHTLNDWTNQSRQTIGGIANGKYSGFSYSGEGYYQFGKQSYGDGAFIDESISAFLAAGRAGYTANVALKPGLTVWGEYLSGSGEGKPTGVFDTLYATNHKFYGFMDMFLSVPGDTRNLGLFDAGGRLQFGPIEKFWGQVDFHHFRTAKMDPNGNQTLGNEIDVVLNYRFTKYLTLQGVWTVFLPQDAMGYVTGAPLNADLKAQQLGYFTLDFKL